MRIEKIEDLIRTILAREFPNDLQKQKIYKAGNRFNFSCPYCGDSKNSNKKRGNFYSDTLAFKCYNGGCGIYKDAVSFFKDYSLINRFSGDEREEIKNILETNKSNRNKYSYGSIDIEYFFDNDISDLLIDRSFFMEKMGLQDIVGSNIFKYILRREQKPDRKFAWDPKKEKIYIFNLTPKDKILGLQVRNMGSYKGGAKYLTYKLSGIYEKLLLYTDQDYIERAKSVDPISHVFGIGTLDFSKDITIFEGPMDSFFWPNSVGLCSLENKFPFDVDNKKFFYDWDRAGIEKSMDLLSKGQTVFNWGKFLDENNITRDKKWDLNDLVVHLRKIQKKVKRLDLYFTNDILDLAYFIND
jgi:hypothetical protein